MKNLVIKSSAPLKGKLVMPGDKSISHRAVIFGSIAKGTTTLRNLLEAEDVLRTVAIFRKLGVSIRKSRGKGGERVWRIQGKGLAALRPPRKVLDCGNSGTTMRLVMGLLAGLPFSSTLTGDDSLNLRPMDRVMRPLTAMGAKVRQVWKGKKRLLVIEGRKLRGINFRSPVASAQVKSALLLAGLTTTQRIRLREPLLSRDHSERMLRAFGVSLQRKGLTLSLGKRRTLKGKRLTLPGDPSSAAFFVVAGLINPHRQTAIVLKEVDLNPTRDGFLRVLKKMGGKIEIRHRRLLGGEPVGDLVVRPAHLKGVRVGGKIVPSLIDEVPILAMAAAVAQGKSFFHDMAELRVKETDRIATLEKNLRRLGVSFSSTKDSFQVEGNPSLSALRALFDFSPSLVKEGARPIGSRGRSESLSDLSPTLSLSKERETEEPKRNRAKSGLRLTVDSFGDHRIAMSLAILGTILPGGLSVRGVECVRTSFPLFFSLLRQIGGKFKINKRIFL